MVVETTEIPPSLVVGSSTKNEKFLPKLLRHPRETKLKAKTIFIPVKIELSSVDSGRYN